MALASRPTRRRARRWLFVGVLAAVAALAVNAVLAARSSGPARQLAQQDYLDQVFPLIQDSAQQGRDIDALRTQAINLSGATITGRLDQLVASTARSLAAVRRYKAPAAMDTAHDLLVATLAVRADSARALRQDMANALGGQPLPAAAAAFSAVGMEMAASDRTYQLFVRALPSLGVAPPSSQWVGDPSVYNEANMTLFLSSLRASTSLAPVHDVGVVLVLTDPAPVNLIGSTEVLPTSKAVNLQIVVADPGNKAERNLTVSATMAPSVGGPTQMLRDFVNLSPGQRQTVSLGGLLPVPNQPTTLTVKIDAAPGETNLGDNTKIITFVMQ